MDALFLAELNERLFVHFSGGQWRTPLGERHIAANEALRAGRIVCAEPADVARARQGLAPDQGSARSTDLIAAWQHVQQAAEALRRVEGYTDTERGIDLAPVPGAGPLVLLSAADAPLAALVGVLVAGASRGVIWKPAPAAAASAHLVMRALGPLAPDGLAMVQGDHASGAALAGVGGMIWASGASVPPELGDPVLRLAARVPRRR